MRPSEFAGSGFTRRQFGAFAAGGALASLTATSPVRAASARSSRGFNLPGWIDREIGVAPSRDVLENLRAAGFDRIRLPVGADPLLRNADAARAMRRRIGDALALCESTGFTTVLDLHPAGDFGSVLREDPAGGGRLAQEAWRGLRDVIAAFPANFVQAELLNEPPMEQATWLDLRDRLAEIVRETCPRHGIIWGPARYQGLWELDSTRPLADAYASVAIHYYSPMAFTHQCENWSGSVRERLGGLPFPATASTPAVAALFEKLRQKGDEEALAALDEAFGYPWNAAPIAADFARAGDWARQQGCPVVLGEFGVLGFCADPVSRATWIRTVRMAAEANGIDWTYWELDQGFGFIKDRRETGGFDAALIEALTGAKLP